MGARGGYTRARMLPERPEDLRDEISRTERLIKEIDDKLAGNVARGDGATLREQRERLVAGLADTKKRLAAMTAGAA